MPILEAVRRLALILKISQYIKNLQAIVIDDDSNDEDVAPQQQGNAYSDSMKIDREDTQRSLLPLLIYTI